MTAVTIERDFWRVAFAFAIWSYNPTYRQPRLNYMPKDDVAIDEIKALEDRRYPGRASTIKTSMHPSMNGESSTHLYRS